MSGLIKVANGDGTFDIVAAGHTVRCALSAEDADAVMTSLKSMEPDET